MEVVSMTAVADEQLALARQTSSGRAAHTLFGGSGHFLRQTVIALVSGRAGITDPLAYIFLISRVLQSIIHLSSVSAPAVTLRFSAFAVQMAIGVYWAWRIAFSL